MPSDRDWAHDPRYDDAALEQFEKRLRRAHPGSRGGYLRVKGATLLRLGDTAAIPTAIRLLHRATETDHFLEVPWAHELLGHAYQETGDLEAAEHHYRQCMATADEHRNGTPRSPSCSSPRC
jgi:tetratricopeptide (TPR) repeat protein